MGEGVKTIIPHVASITIDSRLVGKQSIPVIKDNLEALLKSGLDSGELKLKYLGEEPPSQTTALKEQTEQVYQAIVRATGKAYIEPAMPGTVPNYVWTDILKVPVFTIPYANYDQHNHDVNENLTEKAFLDGIRISYELCAVFRKNWNLAGTWWADLEPIGFANSLQARPFSNLTSSAKKNFTTEPISIFTPD